MSDDSIKRAFTQTARNSLNRIEYPDRLLIDPNDPIIAKLIAIFADAVLAAFKEATGEKETPKPSLGKCPKCGAEKGDALVRHVPSSQGRVMFAGYLCATCGHEGWQLWPNGPEVTEPLWRAYLAAKEAGLL